MASNKELKEQGYQLYMAMGLKRRKGIGEIANAIGVSKPTIYRWLDQEHWEDRYLADTRDEREVFIAEIKNRMDEGHKLLDVIRDEMLMKYAIKVKADTFNPTLEELKTIVELSEKINTRLDALVRDTESNNRADIKSHDDTLQLAESMKNFVDKYDAGDVSE